MKDKLVGSWSLQSFIITPSAGESRAWGRNARGLLIYTEDGHMSVSINRDPVETGNEAKDAFDSVLFYAGTYQVEGNKIVHQVSNATNLARIGKEMIRFAELSGDDLKLTTPQESFGIATLVWRKIK